MRLQTTFRCPQTLCDVSSAFVSRNPRQLRKQVVSAHAASGPPVRMLQVSSADQVAKAIADLLDDLAKRHAGSDQDVTVDVLGRYRFDRDHMPRGRWPGITVGFRTIHSAKGLEADYVIVPNLTTGKYGFPSQIADHPVLELAMAEGEGYPHAEERRLLYVALTRARHQAVLVTVRGQESVFAVELLQQAGVRVSGPEGDIAPPQVCHLCGEGVMMARKGPYGAFLGCSRFPRCRSKAKIEADEPPCVR